MARQSHQKWHTLSYEKVKSGLITCDDCPTEWRLHGRYWWPYPCPGCGTSPEYCRHYGKRPKSQG
jgi:hypothetical protein